MLTTTSQLWKTLRGRSLSADGLLRALRREDTVPVPIFAICDQLGVKVNLSKDIPYSGASRVTKDVAEIWVNTSESNVRQRFTAAHELGHVMLHPEGEMRRDITFAGYSPLEVQANRFAAELLMPEAWVWLAIRSTTGTAADLARFFGVSELAMNVRLKEVTGGR